MGDAVVGIPKAALWKKSQLLLYKLLDSFRATALKTSVISDSEVTSRGSLASKRQRWDLNPGPLTGGWPPSPMSRDIGWKGMEEPTHLVWRYPGMLTNVTADILLATMTPGCIMGPSVGFLNLKKY